MMSIRTVGIAALVTALGACTSNGSNDPANMGASLYPASAPVGAAFGARTLAPTDIRPAGPVADGTVPDAGEAIVPNGLPTGVSDVTAAGSAGGVVGVEHLPPF